MLGPPKLRRLDAPIAVSREDLVPVDHCSRHLETKLDLSCVRDLVRPADADIGRPSIDPVVFFKLQLVMFFEGLRSERQLIATASLNLAHRWHLGSALDESLPDHSSLTRIRQRYGLAVFRRFFEAIVAQCGAAGLVWGEERSLDATKVHANAAMDSLQPRFAVAAHLAQLFAPEEPGGDGDDGTRDPDGTGGDAPARLPVALTPESRGALAERAGARQDWIGNAGRPNRNATSGADRRTADFRISTTDPDATPMPLGDGHTHLGDQDHDVVDGGKARIVLLALVAPAEVQENPPALDLLWRACFRWKLRPRQVTGDTKDGTIENIVAIERAGICAYLPRSAVGQRAGMFGEQDFVDEAAADVSRCPAGQTLRFISQSAATHRRIFQAPAAVCAACTLRPQCTTSARGRRVGRSLDAASLDRARAYSATEPYAKAMRKRQVWGEPLFAEAKAWHGLRRFRLRGLERVNGEALLIAAGQNLKRLLSWHGWGRRPFPSGATGVALPALARLLTPAP